MTPPSMTPSSATSPVQQEPETSVTGRGWFVAATFVVLLAGAAVVWWFLFGGRDLVDPLPLGGPVPVEGKPYLPAEHLDASTARLTLGADGKRVLDVEVRDVKAGETLVVRRRETGKPSSAVLLFLSVAAPAGSVADPAKRLDDPGVLTDVSATTNPTGATNLRIGLEGAVDRVTLVDLRFGAWQGIEIEREGAPPAAR